MDPAPPSPAHKLQPLADALVLEFSQSLASARCCETLKAFLPSSFIYLR